ncbi:MAG: hypothetical protein WBH57_10790 [Anaerolineae bacterium]
MYPESAMGFHSEVVPTLKGWLSTMAVMPGFAGVGVHDELQLE